MKTRNNFAGMGDLKPLLPVQVDSIREIEKELMGTKTPKEKVDMYQQIHGIKKPTTKEPNLKIRSQVFNLTIKSDRVEYNELLNNRKYRIMYFKDTFTPMGDYLIACTFSENLDIKETNDTETS